MEELAIAINEVQSFVRTWSLLIKSTEVSEQSLPPYPSLQAHTALQKTSEITQNVSRRTPLYVYWHCPFPEQILSGLLVGHRNMGMLQIELVQFPYRHSSPVVQEDPTSTAIVVDSVEPSLHFVL